MNNLIDYEGLLRGEGEWKNMQEIICRTFRILIDQNNHQIDLISKLQSQIHLVKDELNQRPTWNDIERMVDSKILNDKKKNSKFNNEVDQLKIEVAHLKSDLEKKVSTNYFELSMKKKMDRSEAIIKANPKYVQSHHSDNDEDIKKLKIDLLHVKSEVESISDVITSNFQSYDIPRVCSDVCVMRSQIEHLTNTVHNYQTKEEISFLLNQKANKLDLETQISQKADSSTLNKNVQRIEQVLEQHEKLITSLRFRSNDTLLSSKDFASSVPMSVRRTEAFSELESNLRNGRMETIIVEMWNNLTNSQAEVKNVRKDVLKMEENVYQLREAQKKAANLEKVELMGVVVEEQRMRIDSIIQGTTKINPIYNTLFRFEEQLKEISSFLSLPQAKSIDLQLDEIRNNVMILKDEVALSREFFESETKQKIESLSFQTTTLESRWDAIQHDRDRLSYLMQLVNFSGTDFATMQEFIAAFQEMRTILTGEGSNLNLAPLNVLKRLKELENKILSQAKTLEKARVKIHNLKCALMTLEGVDMEPSKRISSTKKVVKSEAGEVDSMPIPPYKHQSDEIPEENQTAMKFEDFSKDFPSTEKDEVKSPSFHVPPAPSNAVDFEAALTQLFSSIDEIQVPLTKNGKNNVNRPISLSDVDRRLEEISNEKERLRRLLLSQT